MLDLLVDRSDVNAPADAGRAARSTTLEYSDCVSRNNTTSKANLQTPPLERSRACSQQADRGDATRSLLRSPVTPDANTVLNGRRRRAEAGTPGFPECFTLLRADECFGWPR
nr:hypothetical protein [uncultured bacterium]